MGVLSNLEPRKVFCFFEEITQIPHGSGNVGQISDYLAEFAAKRGLYCVQDELKNIIIVKEAVPGYEDEPVVILQGHMDMVAVKKPDCDIDMRKEGLRIAVKGDEIYAEGTSLGGDDGIAVAYALALLDSDAIKHPRLEVIVTVDEEVGMDGARGIDLSVLTGNRMVNLDSEEEGIFLTSCAGGARVKCRLPVAAAEQDGEAMEVVIGGLLGGHSGGEIHKERGNSNCLFGRLLNRLAEKLPVCLLGAEGGLADNAISRETKAVLVVQEQDRALFLDTVKEVEAEFRSELASRDPDVRITVGEGKRGNYRCASAEDTKKAAAFLIALPNGVQAMSADMHGLVETSLNLGILKYEDGVLSADFSVRSSVESAKRALIDRLCAVTGLAGGSCMVSGDYPGWKYRKDSPLRDKMTALYEKMYGKAPKVEAIHAGLECGILGSKIKDLDCVSMGPDMKAIHTTEETLSISSTGRVWEFLVRLLEEKEK
ncbi:aminoacyl-histidine dipeptidase [Acetatifactor aquisgranensis]|uniref:aminoacyl-histidine dipeptidase n=1 Tax=Acetatifactor aquisgranensis TaxID=2941233 RepID=UPI00203E7858|nr:aminoacyl-histidine dipeptidase [Acetatifactor aquisgranensis]MCI8542765.1 aminoacyl-histidine dipeptidase [Lachnospiraceae bacterium]